MIWDNGKKYEGMWKDGAFSGQGTFTCPDFKYEGSWRDGMPHGQGTFEWSDGKRYVGGYVNGKK